MKKIAALAIIIALFITALPVFAADTICGMSREEYKKKPLYDKIMDPIKNFKVSEKDKVKPIFGDKVNQGSGKATK